MGRMGLVKGSVEVQRGPVMPYFGTTLSACDDVITGFDFSWNDSEMVFRLRLISVILSFSACFHVPHNNRMFPPRITSNTRKRMLKCSSMQPTTELTTLGEVMLNKSTVVLLRGCSQRQLV